MRSASVVACTFLTVVLASSALGTDGFAPGLSPDGATASYVVLLKDQRSHEASLAVRSVLSPFVDALVDQRTALVHSAADLAEPLVLEINRQIDEAMGVMRLEISFAATRLHAPSRTAFESFVTGLGGTVTYRSPLVNLLVVQMAPSHADALRAHPLVASVEPEGIMDVMLDVSVPTIGTSNFWTGGPFTGGPFEIIVPDTGVDSSHPALTGKISDAQVFHDAAQMQGNYADNPSSPDDLHGHGTHIAGIVASQDSTYRGVAYGMLGVVNVKFGYVTNFGGGQGVWSDAWKGIDWAVFTAGGDVLTFSYGGGSDNDGTDGMSLFMDALVDDLGIPVSAAAGNSGPGGSTIIQPATAYNLMTVGAMSDRDTVSRADDGIAGFSSRGPTGDGRLKPDITAPGANIRSTAHSWETGSDWVDFGGTSMASPHVGASLLLFLQSAGGPPMFPARAKAVLLNSATDMGSAGPDTTYGWGYLDLATAWANRNDVVEDDAEEGNPQFFRLAGAGNDRATMVWQKHLVYAGSFAPTTWYPLNNLDLWLYDEMLNTALDRSLSPRDDVEQVQFPAAAPGVVKVTVAGALGGVPVEAFALAGQSPPIPVNPPALAPTVTAPASVNQGDTFLVTANVANPGGLRVFGAQVRLNIPPELTLVSGANPAFLGTILEGTAGSAAWTLSAPVAGTHVLTADADGNAYEESYAGVSPPESMFVADLEPPMIAAESAVPSPQNPGMPVNISAQVTDNVGLSSVEVEVWDPLGTSLGVDSLVLDPVTGRQYLERSYVTLGDYAYTITAVDTSGFTVSASGAFRIQDMLAPTISNVAAIPDPQEVYGSVNVTATVTDNVGVTGVYLEVLDPVGGLTNVAMDWDGNTVFQERGYDLLGTYDFRILASDAVGNRADVTGTFVVRDTTIPLANAGPDQDVEFGSPLVLDGSGSSDNVGIVSYEWSFVEGGPITIVGVAASHMFATLGTFVVTLTVEDSSGNQDTDTLNVRVVEARPPEIHDVRATPPLQDVGLAVTVTARVWDAFGIADVELRIRDPLGSTSRVAMFGVGDRYGAPVFSPIKGLHMFQIWAVDTNGNWNSSSGAFEVADLSPPSVSMTAVPSPQDIFAAVEVTATVSDNDVVDRVWTEVRDPAGHAAILVPMTLQGETWHASFTPLVLGPHLAIVWAKDASGNLGSAAVAVLAVDRVPPSLLVDTPDVAEVLTLVPILVSVDDDLGSYVATLEVRAPSGASLGSRTLLGESPIATSWMFDKLGPHDWFARAVDPSGNEKIVTGTIEVRDSQPPIAHAGPDRTVMPGTWVPFDGSASRDNFGIATYTWTLTATGGTRQLRGQNVSFEFAHVETVVVQLAVVDLAGNVGTDSATIRILPADRDGDGATDEDETTVLHTDPTQPDTDGDGLLDGADPDPRMPEINPVRWFFSWWGILILVVILFTLLALIARRKDELLQPTETTLPTERLVGAPAAEETLTLPPPPEEDEIPPPPPD